MARFWVGGGTNSNFNSSPVTNWAASSGGAGNQTVPDVTQDVTFDGAGASGNSAANCIANISFLSLTFTSGYTQTITISGTNIALTVAGNFTDNTAHSWTVTSTSVNPLIISAASTIASGGKTFPASVSFTGSNTKTLNGNWTITGTLICTTTTTTINKTVAEILTCAGWTVTGTTAGTINITLSGGTWSGGGANTISGTVSIAGNVTVSGSINYSTGTLSYASGTVTTTSSTLTIAASTTLNTNGISWNNITLSAAETITINSLLTINGTLTINASVAITFAGTSGFTASTFTCLHNTTTSVTFKNSITYTITTAFNAFASRTGAILTFTSDDGTLKANLTLNNGATCNVLASFTRIDASNGRAIWTFNGTVTTCNNIISLTDLSFVTARPNVIQGNSNY